jgi:hypothetical protein
MLVVIAISGLLSATSAFAQTVPPPHGAPARTAPQLRMSIQSDDPVEPLPRFDLDFPGGRPSDLVAVIQKNLPRRLNAIIQPEDDNDVVIPPLKMNQVTVSELFKALEAASRKAVAIRTGTTFTSPGQRPAQTRDTWQQFITSYSFSTLGPVNEDSIWYFTYTRPPVYATETRISRFWQLEPYLERYEIDDITTAIQTGYKLLGEPSPKINFHMETKLLIAVGDASKLNLIDSVLEQLTPVKTTGGAHVAPQPRPVEATGNKPDEPRDPR